MKPQLYTRLALGLVLGGSALGLSACDFDAAKEAFENTKIVLGLESQKTTVGVLFVDAATGQPLSGDFEVQFTGPDATTVVDSYGDPLAKRVVRGGTVGFSIANAKTPSTSAPIAVRLSGAPSGYLPISEQITLTDTAAVSVSVRAVRPGTAAQGTQTASASANASATSGTASAVAATTPAAPPPSGGQAPPQASLAAPAGTTLRGSNNQALAGAVTATVIAVDPAQPRSFELLPGGLSTGGFGKVAAPSRLAVAAGYFQATVGGVAVASMTAASGSTLTLEFGIPPTMVVNPQTGQAWAAGQTVPAYRYSLTEGWVADGDFTVVSLGNNRYSVRVTPCDPEHGVVGGRGDGDADADRYRNCECKWQPQWFYDRYFPEWILCL